ncbi:MAG: hypothetical protein C0391_06190 [Anaerolinea sp.]|nr:hypothetical protein [Anaerolinea sp.]
METSSRTPRDCNPATRSAHQRQFFVQILLPVVVISAGLLALGLLAAFTGSQVYTSRTAVWAHISTIFMVLIVIVVSLGCLVLTLASIYGLGWLLSHLPGYSYIAQLYVQLFTSRIQSIANRTTQPFITVKSGWAAARALFNKRHSRPQGQ